MSVIPSLLEELCEMFHSQVIFLKCEPVNTPNEQRKNIPNFDKMANELICSKFRKLMLENSDVEKVLPLIRITNLEILNQFDHEEGSECDNDLKLASIIPLFAEYLHQRYDMKYKKDPEFCSEFDKGCLFSCVESLFLVKAVGDKFEERYYELTPKDVFGNWAYLRPDVILDA